MPDPAKSVGDIDDVLSSIRRLVAEQPGPARTDANRGSDAPPKPASEDRLVLTPALRVTDRDGPAKAGMPDSVGGGETTEPQEVAEATPEPAEHVETGVEAVVTIRNQAETDLEFARNTAEHADTTVEAEEPVAEPVGSGALEEAGGQTSLDNTQPETAQDDAVLPADMDPETPEGQGDVTAASEHIEFEASEDPMPESLASVPAKYADRPDMRDTLQDPEHEGAENAGLAQDDTSGPDAAEGADEPRAIGDDGWRPEMRLFDWDASAQTEEAAPVVLMNGAEQFESETGDANWPDETADRAVLDLAAVRETSATDTAKDADTHDSPPAEGIVAGFTPIFSRRTSGPAVRDASSAADAQATTEQPAHQAPSQPERAGGSPLDDLTDTPAADIADTAQVHLGIPPEPETEGAAADGDDTETGVAEAHAVAFSSVRDMGTDPSAEVPSPDLDAVDTAPLVDDLPSLAATQDEGESTASGARLTVLVGKGDPDTTEPNASPDMGGTDAPAAADLRSIDTRVLEEEVLRRIVAEAVREELQGALGERITRNVRKLVRREIRLVLAVDELD
jgi:hypothetical protein